MAELALKPGTVEINLTATATLHAIPPSVATAPGGLYPLMSRAFEMDEYRIMAGWPVEIPKHDIRGISLISASGEVLSNRVDPTTLETEALIRWVASEESYDQTALAWRPIHSQITPVAWTTGPDYAPDLITNYEYRMGDERFYRAALNFDSDESSHMWASFESILAGPGYTVLMVMSPNSVYGNDVEVPYNGLWSPGMADPENDTNISDQWTAVHSQGRYLYVSSESSEPVRGISINPGLNSTAPLYIALVLGRPNSYLYVGEGPNSIRVESVPTGDFPANLEQNVVLGRAVGDLDHTMDMALFDLSVYADTLSGEQVANEFAQLARSYGGDA